MSIRKRTVKGKHNAFTVCRKSEGKMISLKTKRKSIEAGLSGKLKDYAHTYSKNLCQELYFNKRDFIFRIEDREKLYDRIFKEYEDMFLHYRNSYSSLTEKILASSLSNYPFKGLFKDSFPMMILRNCSKMFFVNEMEAVQFLLLIKEIGWIPNNIVKSSLVNFQPPRSIFQNINPENGLYAVPILVHLMLLFYAAKMLLNEKKVPIICQQYIEATTYKGFGCLFNCWIREIQSLMIFDVKLLNQMFNKISSEPINYKIPDRPKSNNIFFQLVNQFAELSNISEMNSPNISKTRKSSFNSIGLDKFCDNLAELPGLGSRQSSIDYFNYFQPSFSRQSSGGLLGFLDDAKLGKRRKNEDFEKIEKAVYREMLNSSKINLK